MGHMIDGHLTQPCPPDPLPEALAPTPGSDLPVLNLAALERVAAILRPEKVASYMRGLAEKGEALLGRLRAPDALAGRDDALAEAAHTIAGTAGMVGFERLSTVARDFEHPARTGSAEAPARAGALIVALEATLGEMHSRGAAGGGRQTADSGAGV
jgi:HPt (histidine-containing phosphotransfer) domain-containing protein